MDEAVCAVVAVSSSALVAFAFVACMLWRGSWLFLLTGRAAANGEHDEACRKLGRRAAVMLFVGCALMATLVVFQIAVFSRNVPLASAFSLANNAAFIALIVVVIWFFIVQRPNEDETASRAHRSVRPRSAGLDHLHAATIVFVVAYLAVIAAVGIVAAGI